MQTIHARGRLVLRVILVLLCFLLLFSIAFAAAGDLDTTFDGDGKVTLPIGSGSDMGDAVAIQSNGKIVVAGGASNGSNYDIAVLRYQSGLTTTFGTSGVDIADHNDRQCQYDGAIQRRTRLHKGSCHFSKVGRVPGWLTEFGSDADDVDY